MTKSTSKPNLQNLPIRTKDGREIRKAFLKDCRIQNVDYSKMEELILAKYKDVRST